MLIVDSINILERFSVSSDFLCMYNVYAILTYLNDIKTFMYYYRYITIQFWKLSSPFISPNLKLAIYASMPVRLEFAQIEVLQDLTDNK